MNSQTGYVEKILNFPELVKRLGVQDMVFTFDRLMEEMDLGQYLNSDDGTKTGRHGYNKVNMLKTILFAFMDTGYASLRELEDRCRTNVRYMFLMEGEVPCYRTFGYFINRILKQKIETIYLAVMERLVTLENIDLQHLYIDGTKLEANANKYSWVWKKATEKSRYRLYKKVSSLFKEINSILPEGTAPFRVNTEYSPDGLRLALRCYTEVFHVDRATFVHGRGHRKTKIQRCFEKLEGFVLKLQEYVVKISTCGKNRNSYSKTDHDATFMRVKTDYMRNDQLLPAYNIQLGVADEYIVAADVQQFCSDTDCFVPLMEQFHEMYGFYPKYPVADAGYGSYNNYLYCEQRGMEKYMKFGMYKKTVQDKAYSDDPFRAVNFKRDEAGNLMCPGGKRMSFAYRKPVRGNLYGRQEEVYVCEDCSGCLLADQCKKTDKNRTVRLNEELTSIHKEVLRNLESIQGCLLRTNRSIQAEGAFGIIKQDKKYRRIVRKGFDSVKLELLLVVIGFNLYKYNNKQMKAAKTA